MTPSSRRHSSTAPASEPVEGEVCEKCLCTTPCKPWLEEHDRTIREEENKRVLDELEKRLSKTIIKEKWEDEKLYWNSSQFTINALRLPQPGEAAARPKERE